jgi:hypothetical protein
MRQNGQLSDMSDALKDRGARSSVLPFPTIDAIDPRAQATRFTRPQLLSEAQMPRSSRNRSMGADELNARMR